MPEKILVVDDSALSRRTLRRILESAGYSVVEAEEGMAALELYFIEKAASGPPGPRHERDVRPRRSFEASGDGWRRARHYCQCGHPELDPPTGRGSGSLCCDQ